MEPHTHTDKHQNVARFFHLPFPSVVNPKILHHPLDSQLLIQGDQNILTLRIELRVTYLIPYGLSCGVILLWSVLSCGVWDFTLFVTLLAKRITCARLHYFHKMQNAMLILSQDTQERTAQKQIPTYLFATCFGHIFTSIILDSLQSSWS